MASIMVNGVQHFTKLPLWRNNIVLKRLGTDLTNLSAVILNRLYSSQTHPTFQKVNEASKMLSQLEPEQMALQHADYFDVKSMVSLKDLFSAKVYMGHKSGCRNIYMTPYIFGSRQDIDIIDLDQTLECLHQALNFTAHIVYRGGIILFLSRHNQMLPLVEKMAADCGEFSHCRYWKGGTFTNSTIQFGSETRLPDLCIFINTLNNAFLPHRGMTEATKLLIPVVGIVDTNCDPRLVTYPVPGNDDSPSAVSLYCRLFKEVILKAKARRKEDELL